MRLDSGAAVDVLMMPPHVHGRLFYNDDMSGFNFSRIKASIGDVSDKLIRYAKFDNRPSLAAQSALIAVTAMSHGFISSGADAASIAQLFCSQQGERRLMCSQSLVRIRHGRSQVAHQAVLQSVDPSVDRESLSTIPCVPHDRGLAYVGNLFDDVELAK